MLGECESTGKIAGQSAQIFYDNDKVDLKEMHGSALHLVSYLPLVIEMIEPRRYTRHHNRLVEAKYV